MTTKTLSISEEAYNELFKLKRTSESISQLILRLTLKKGSSEVIISILQDIHVNDPINVLTNRFIN